MSDSGSSSDDDSSPADEWDSRCSVCHKRGDLMCCDGCPNVYHVKCAGLTAIPEDAWFCSDCQNDRCAVCGKSEIGLKEHVICGDDDDSVGCARIFHLVSRCSCLFVCGLRNCCV